MKNSRFFAICILPLSAFFICSCNVQGSETTAHKSFTYDLRGTWESNEPGLYSGTLVINSDTITIDGYGEDWTSFVGDDNKRPCKDFPKRVPLKGYSEEGKILIDYGGSVRDIPYTYTELGNYPDKTKILEFSFGGRLERLQWKGDS